MDGGNSAVGYLFQRKVLEVQCCDLHSGNSVDACSVIGQGALCGEAAADSKCADKGLIHAAEGGRRG
jgi:hypothetical protein